jgi:hypothetical protein
MSLIDVNGRIRCVDGGARGVAGETAPGRQTLLVSNLALDSYFLDGRGTSQAPRVLGEG